jgi:hypothetical protein
MQHRKDTDVTTATILPGAVERLTELISDEDLEAMVRPYTLADAIREGSSVTDQHIGGWVDESSNKACALSAAFVACKARGMI